MRTNEIFHRRSKVGISFDQLNDFLVIVVVVETSIGRSSCVSRRVVERFRRLFSSFGCSSFSLLVASLVAISRSISVLLLLCPWLLLLFLEMPLHVEQMLLEELLLLMDLSQLFFSQRDGR